MTRSTAVDEAVEEAAMAVAIFVSLLFLYEVLESFFRASSGTTPQESGHHAVLGERALERLEDGETVLVERWHGHALELSGTQVIDVDVLEDGQEDDAGD